VIGDARFVPLGLRHDGGFVGEHDRQTGAPIPDHIGARPEDLTSLVEGMLAFDRSAEKHLDAVIAAAALAFGFVYVHPYPPRSSRGSTNIVRFWRAIPSGFSRSLSGNRRARTISKSSTTRGISIASSMPRLTPNSFTPACGRRSSTTCPMK
jgi:hypothetical protein